MFLLRIFLYTLCTVVGAGIGVAMVLYGYSDFDTVITTAQLGLNIAALIYVHKSLDDRLLQRKRTFSIDMGLISSKISYTSKQAIEVLVTWQTVQNTLNKPYLSGKIVEVAYPYYDNNLKQTVIEPGIWFFGELHPIYHQNVSDQDGILLVKQLASEFGLKLSQKRIFWTFCELTSIWENPLMDNPDEVTVSQPE